MKYIADVKELKSKNGRLIRVRATVLGAIDVWNTILLGKGWKRIDDIHTRGIFSLFFYSLMKFIIQKNKNILWLKESTSGHLQSFATEFR